MQPEIWEQAELFAAQLRRTPISAPGVPRAVFLVSPESFFLAAESARDNVYMQMAQAVDGARAAEQHRQLALALAAAGVPVMSFPGSAETPDAVFPNNVYATAPRRLIVGAMRHPVRQREARRQDIRDWFRAVLGYAEIDLSTRPLVAELTGSLVIDRARRIGFCGLSERCDRAGAAAMAAAFDLRHMLTFDLAGGEYHSNVVMSALAGRGVLLCPTGFADPGVADAIASAYGDSAILIDPAEKAAFVGNCIALGESGLWMSAAAEAALRPATRSALIRLGFQIHSVALDELEKAGGSLRCMIGEIY
ncbi:MAG: arginine deiminase-related protein [Lysobacterales bacterium]